MSEMAMSDRRADALTEHARRHPLASKAGFAMFVELLESDLHWSACTKPQRRLISLLCEPIIPLIVKRKRLVEADLPLLPVSTLPATVAALNRRGMAANGRLTGKAVHAYYWQVWMLREAERAT